MIDLENGLEHQVHRVDVHFLSIPFLHAYIPLYLDLEVKDGRCIMDLEILSNEELDVERLLIMLIRSEGHLDTDS